MPNTTVVLVVTNLYPTAKHYLDYIGVIPVVIMEFVDRGCLRSFLNSFKKTASPDSHSKKKIDFLLYGKQIAEGMNYLVSSMFVCD